jgi:hypothetical protein
MTDTYLNDTRHSRLKCDTELNIFYYNESCSAQYPYAECICSECCFVECSLPSFDIPIVLVLNGLVLCVLMPNVQVGSTKG